MKYKVAELEGTLLDAAVAMCEGEKPRNILAGVNFKSGATRFLERYEQYSTCWEDGGPIIERERIDIAATDRDQVYGPTTWDAWADGAGGFMASGPSPLIAAMRAYVSSRFGKEVELP